MALFNRNKTNQAGMAPEVSDYYQAEGRDRAWVAWLLAITTLLVTIFVVFGVFYGGRWAFRKIKDNDKLAPIAVQTDKDKSSDQASTDSAPTTSEPTTTATGSSSNAPATNNNSTATDSATATKSDLPDTGPGDTLAIFVAVSALAYVAHRKFLATR